MTRHTLPHRPTAWLATFTRRWHANPDLCHTVDPVGWHSGRMGVLALHIWGDGVSRDLLVACLCHDLGEHMTGDVAWPAKQDKALGEALDRIEEASLKAMGMAYSLTGDDARRLKYLDRLDAYLWVLHNQPAALERDGWDRALEWLMSEGQSLGRVPTFTGNGMGEVPASPVGAVMEVVKGCQS
jgi:hypothetical protein